MNLPGALKTTRGRFGATVLLSLIPLLLVWWLGAGLLIDALRPPASFLAGVFQLADGITNSAKHDWLATTGLTRASGTEAGPVIVSVPSDTLRRLLLGFPIFLALMATPPRSRPIMGILIGSSVLIVLFVFSALSFVFNEISVIVNHKSSLLADTVPPPAFTVTRAPMGEVQFFLAALIPYLAFQCFPLIVPVILWATLNQQGVALLMMGDTPEATEPMAEMEASAEPITP